MSYIILDYHHYYYSISLYYLTNFKGSSLPLRMFQLTPTKEEIERLQGGGEKTKFIS